MIVSLVVSMLLMRLASLHGRRRRILQRERESTIFYEPEPGIPPIPITVRGGEVTSC